MSPIIIKIRKPRFRKRLAMFDFDCTLVKPASGGVFPKNADDWMWWHPSVPNVVKSYYVRGYQIIIFTNQSKLWKQDQIVAALLSLNIPCTIAIAFDKQTQKPSRDMFDIVIGDRNWDLQNSLFVGDALGRPKDHSDMDYMFARNIGVRVVPPEQIFNITCTPRSSQMA
jgi:bifunctional polynucleotide phosphatase/kinase